MNTEIFAIILAGGSGTRLWPLSRHLLPKQFLRFGKRNSLFEATVNRVSGLAPGTNILIVTNNMHAFGSGYHQMKKYKQIIEPCSRNTAPAIGLAAAYLMKTGKDPVMIAMPSDHIITGKAEFLKVLKLAVGAACKGRIVTLGIVPDRPETGYGYIEAASRPEKFNAKALEARRFVEKPDFKTAQNYLKSGRYFWNSGIFIFRASTMLHEMKKHLPRVYALLERISRKAFSDRGRIVYPALEETFSRMPSVSIDYGIMEKSNIVSVIPSDIGWNDIGSWYYLYQISAKDSKGNALVGDVIAIDTEDSLIYSDKRLVAAIGVKGLAVIETADALLVSELNHSQEVKKIVEELKKRGRTQHIEHLTVDRPWGSYTVLENLPNYKVKKLRINPGHRISYQYHKQRSEHWFVVSGEAEITRDAKKILLKKNRHIDIPAYAKHMLFNPGKIPLEVIEVQSGEYFGEDDIIRLDDKYGRGVI
ncbi:MAG: mannose-1-phosphate guanylyltransferase/mannose-6-phosphate isomerase [Elusimicrobia bacterium]|nr:mannose-1-phosphate guanylyltransferase/mannose-6-phosphate isomerase [Elusimicrobiota bacterium]